MGMAASQARLLSITARLTNNENSGQSISYAKQRLSDQTQQITAEYNEALETTKLTVLTGFNGADATYTDISYTLMTGPEMAANTKQYVVTDTKGKVLVTKNIAEAYQKANGNYNQFLANVASYSQVDITAQKTYKDVKDRTEEQKKTEQQIHEAWDKYFATIGVNLGDDDHDFGFNFTETVDENGGYAIGQGYVGYARTEKNDDGSTKYEQIYQQKTDENGNLVYEKDADGNDDKSKPVYDTTKPIYQQKTDENGNLVYEKDADGNDDKSKPVYDTTKPVYDTSKPVYAKDKGGAIIYDPINYEGTSDEQRELFDYAMAITEAYYRNNSGGQGKNYNLQYNQDLLKTANNADNKSMLTYYKNIFTKMQSSGYFTYTDTPADAVKDPEHFKYSSKGTGTAGNVEKSPLKDNTVFEAALRDGSLRLEYYSTTSKSFKTTTISEDNCIQEVADERAIAKAESKYNQDMQDLENKDKKLDLELKKLDTEHSALQTEYESVKNVVDKNVQNSFKTFG